MKKILLYAVLLMGGIAGAQNITIPDAIFKSRLVYATPNTGIARNAAGQPMIVDVNHDGEIQQSEADAVYELDVHSSGIASLTGIASFTNLKKLDCGVNLLTALDVSALSNLIRLDCRVNTLQSLNVTGLSALEYLSFEYNNLTAFSPTGLTALKTITGRNNSLTSLDVSLFPALNGLFCDHNQLTVLNAAAAPLLSSLSCSNNQIANLNVAGLPLTYLDYSDNPLPAANISTLTSLEYLGCRNVGAPVIKLNGLSALINVDCSHNPISVINTQDLTALELFFCEYTQLLQLDLSHSPNLKYFHAGNNPLLTSINIHNEGLILYPGECSLLNNPSLQMICIDEDEEDLILQYYEIYQAVAPYMSTTCEYVPGEIYNTIKGKLRLDLDGNGCTDADPKSDYHQVKIFDGTTEKIRYANHHGDYFILVRGGTYTVSAPYNGTLFTSLPATAAITFTGMNNELVTQDFCITPNGEVNDVTVTLGGGFSRPGFDCYYHIFIRNNGNTVANGTVSFAYDDSLMHFVTAEPTQDSSASGTLSWNYSNLLPFEQRTITVKMDVNSPTETPAVNIDDILSFTTSITMQGTDVNPADNTFVGESLVVGSFDPNNIICMEGEKEPVENIGKYLNYVINFENTGNAAAEFVVVSQELDAAKFDVSSFELLGSSHAVDVTRIGNNVVYRFEDINLGAAAQGNVQFRIKTLASLAEGDQVMNKANIVFDYNYALITNDAVTTFETILGSETFIKDKSITIYPNPSKDIVNIITKEDIQGIEVYDIQGRLLQTLQIKTSSAQIDLSGRQSGIYLIKVATAKGVMVQKVIKQ